MVIPSKRDNIRSKGMVRINVSAVEWVVFKLGKNNRGIR
jgi:hypothetical protein